MWEAASREGSLMLALAETLPAGPLPCYSWLDNPTAKLLSRVLLRQIPAGRGRQEWTLLSSSVSQALES